MIEEMKIDRPNEARTRELLSLVERGEYEVADALAHELLKEYPECAEAYLALLLIELGLGEVEDFYYTSLPPITNENFKRVLMYAEGELRELFDDFLGYEKDTIEKSGLEFADRGDYYELTMARSAIDYLELPAVYQGKIIGRIGYGAFRGSEALEKITIQEGVTLIDDAAFSACEKLYYISIPDSVTSIGAHAFADCKALEYISIPDGVSTIGANAFLGCLSIRDIRLPRTLSEIEDLLLFGCKGLTRVTIPDSVSTIGKLAFAGCTSLDTIRLPKKLIRIGESAFLGCRSLKAVIIPRSVAEMSSDVFDECESLKIYYEGTAAEFKKKFGDDMIKKHSIYFYSDTDKLFAKNLWHYVDESPIEW